jgi:hypothetical protein
MIIHEARLEHGRARLIAFYLPQYYPIPENDEWWGKGFTEWTNVAKARPLFPKHFQPNFPADLGFYDLRVSETRIAQAELAKNYGIEAFCYWHYWFDGKRLLERPFTEVLESGKPDFHFCLAWANQSWSGIWYGAPDRVLIEQTYPGEPDFKTHFYALLKAFSDERYVTVDGKPLFIVYYPIGLPNPRQFSDCWRQLASKEGLKGLYLAAITGREWDPEKNGFDATIVHNPGVGFEALRRIRNKKQHKYWKKFTGSDLNEWYRLCLHRPTIYQYSDFIKHALPVLSTEFEQYPCVTPNWDNSPRSGQQGIVLQNSTPTLFAEHLGAAMQQVAQQPEDKRLVFIKSWNEWAESNYLEPDQRYGVKYLEAIKGLIFEKQPIRGGGS